MPHFQNTIFRTPRSKVASFLPCVNFSKQTALRFVYIQGYCRHGRCETPLMDKIIRWNQGLINKEYLTDSGKIDGKDAGECVLPSALGLSKESL